MTEKWGNLPLRRKVLSVAVLVTFFVLLALLIGPCLCGNEPTQQADWTKTSIGDTVVVSAGFSSGVFVGATESDYDGVVEALLAKDRQGMQNMVVLGRAFLVPDSSRALFLTTSWTKAKIRLLGGAYAGRAAWLNRHYVLPVQREHSPD